MLNKIETLNKLIILSEKKTELLKELKESILYEKSIYSIDSAGDPEFVFLIDNKTNDVIRTGRSQIKSFLNYMTEKPGDIYNPKNIKL